MQYKFKEGESEKPVDERIIEKTGHVITFNMVQFRNDKEKYEKAIREAEANRANIKAIIDNLDLHHPTIKELSDFDRHTISMYHENKAKFNTWDKQVTDIHKEFDEYLAEQVEIERALPELTQIESPLAVEGGEVVDKTDDKNTETKKEESN